MTIASRSCRTLAAALAFTCFAALVTGCASPAEKSQGSANIALKDFRRSLDTFDNRVTESVRSIDRLQSPHTYDIDRAYMDYMTEYFNVVADASSISERAEVMRDQGVEYFVTARKEATANNEPKAEAELAQRQAASKLVYDTLQDRLSNLKDQYNVYRGQLNGVYKALNRNVSREHVEAVSPQLNAAKDQAAKVHAAIAAAVVEADKLTATAMPKK